ncbi:hypothetical protein E3N88_29184 [Mikania micrantha]|uniref:Uncharacterized protein n=1 Tax=Mikania micrantha TaxID=192012 RepID=A0A5N6MI27_9ASTR|nr:hypothetical protein E3N88_29184 [Mikania micrantha]
MANVPRKKKTKSPRIIVSSPVVTSSVPVSVTTSSIPVSVKTTMPSSSFHILVCVAPFVAPFAKATTVTTSFPETSASRVDMMFEGLDDLDLNFSLYYDDSELRRRISLLSQEFDKYKKQKEKFLKKKLSDIQGESSTAIHTEARVHEDVEFHLSGENIVDPDDVNIEDADDEEKVDYEDSDYDEHPGFDTHHDDDGDGDDDGVAGASGSNV